MEFGHKVLLCESPEKFITDYEVYEKQKSDCELTETGDRASQEAIWGPGQKWWRPTWASVRTKRSTRSWPSKSRPSRYRSGLKDYADKVLAHWHAFRAGIEGTISGLKRAFRLVRCFFQGFKSFAASVGLGVFCHNLIVLAEYEPD